MSKGEKKKKSRAFRNKSPETAFTEEKESSAAPEETLTAAEPVEPNETPETEVLSVGGTEVLTSEDTPQQETEVPASEEAPQPEAEVLSAGETEVLASEEAPQPETEVLSAGETEVPAAEEAPQPEAEVLSAGETEVPAAEEAPQPEAEVLSAGETEVPAAEETSQENPPAEENQKKKKRSRGLRKKRAAQAAGAAGAVAAGAALTEAAAASVESGHVPEPETPAVPDSTEECKTPAEEGTPAEDAQAPTEERAPASDAGQSPAPETASPETAGTADAPETEVPSVGEAEVPAAEETSQENPPAEENQKKKKRSRGFRKKRAAQAAGAAAAVAAGAALTEAAAASAEAPQGETAAAPDAGETGETPAQEGAPTEDTQAPAEEAAPAGEDAPSPDGDQPDSPEVEAAESSGEETSAEGSGEAAPSTAEEAVESGESAGEGGGVSSEKPRKKKKFFKRPVVIICIILLVLILIGAGCAGGYEYWYYTQPKFQDYTIELGTQSVSIADFFTEYANAEKVSFITDPSTVDINHAGDVELVLAQGKKEETVTLHVVDTVAPVVEFVPEMVKSLSYVPDPNDFIVSIEDYADTTVAFAEDLSDIDTYEDLELTVVVTDESGNTTTGVCLLSYTWLKEEYTMELGYELQKTDVLMIPSQGLDLIDQEALDEINSAGVGTYDLASTTGSKTVYCQVTVVDTTPPELEVQDVTVYSYQTASLSNFLVSAEDLSGDVDVHLTSSLPNGKIGTYTVTIEAVDPSGNTTTADAKFTVKKDDIPPTISGLSNITLTKGASAPDYLSGVTAKDNIDGTVSVSYDASSVKYDTAGTYYVTYTAKDSDGNVTTAKRKVTINHNADDTNALVASIAKSVGSDPKKLQEYVRSHVSYSGTYGGDDPVWYGFTNKTGNCFVHAKCLAALYDYYGIPNYIVNTTDGSHYWNIVMTSSGWRHIDSTPASQHPSRYMTDEDRYKNLQGRDWDRSKWPACN